MFKQVKHSVRWEYEMAARQWPEGITVLVQHKYNRRPPVLYGHFRPDWVGTEHYGKEARFMRLTDVLREPFPKSE
jgi:hypothetical protein